MCVIMLVDNKKNARPTDIMVEKAWLRNPHGAGIAWREGDEVVWQKGMTYEEICKAIKETPLPYVAHFRHSSPAAGSEKNIKPAMCHPFPVDRKSSLALTGRTKGYVLFHNGNWSAWEFEVKQAAIHSNTPLPVGKWSDSRALAFLCSIYGLGFMELLSDQKGLAFGPKYYEVFSGRGWYPLNEIWCSNDEFMTMSQRMWNVCQDQHCRRVSDIGLSGLCPEHQKAIDGGSKEVAKPEEARPFQQTQGDPRPEIVDLIWAEKKHQEKDQHGERLISKGKIKEIREAYDKLTSDSPKQRVKGYKALIHLTRYLTQCLGQLPRHATTNSFLQ